MGDFNLQLESSSSDVRQLTGILESFDLNQQVNFPTHINGHSLHVMIFSKGCDVLSVSPSDAISDHFSVIADLKIPTDHSHTVPQIITYRKLKAINMEAFKADVKISDLIKNPKTNANELAQQYDIVLSTLIDFHASQTEESLCPSLGSLPTLAQGPSALAPLLFGTTFYYLSVQPPQLSPSAKTSQNIPFRLDLPRPPQTPVCPTAC